MHPVQLIKKFFQNSNVLVVISGVLVCYATTYVIFALAVFCFVPFFIALHCKSPLMVFKLGLIFGASISVVGFYWMIPAAEQFTGDHFGYGILAYLVSIFIFSVFWGIVAFGYSLLNKIATFPVLINGLIAASFWVLIEFIWKACITTLPWFFYQTGSAFAGNLYAIQPVAVFGIHIATFVIILINYLIAQYLVQGKWEYLTIPAIVFVGYLFFGYTILLNFDKKASAQYKQSKPVKVAILAGNISSKLKWDNETGNLLVEKLLGLTREAEKLKPEMILWSESAIPWTFRPDDDLILEILRITRKAQITHILGVNTQGDHNQIYNSVYCILPDGAVISRYDKQNLLSLIEKPLAGYLLPFYACRDCYYIQSQYSKPLHTPQGNAGIMICNESAISNSAARMAQNHADFIFNLGNDAWFTESYVPRMHFYYTRLRAVETRKDIVINNNLGISGFIQASGRIVEARKSNSSYVSMFSVQPNNIFSLNSLYPLLWVYISASFITGCIMIFLLKNQFKSI